MVVATLGSASALVAGASVFGVPNRAVAGPVEIEPVQPKRQVDVVLNVNGVERRLPDLDAHTPLRDHLQLIGSKKGCALGACGACTLLIVGRRVNSCLMLAVMSQGKAITTMEGLAQDGELHPLQAASRP